MFNYINSLSKEQIIELARNNNIKITGKENFREEYLIKLA